VGEALKPIRDKVKIATKCGVKFMKEDKDGNPSVRMNMDSSPETIRKSSRKKG